MAFVAFFKAIPLWGYQLLAILALAAFLGGLIYHRGEASVQVKWDASVAAIAKVEQAIQANAMQDAAVERNRQANLLHEVIHAKDDAMRKLVEMHANEIAAIRASGGLRISASACSASGMSANPTDPGLRKGASGTIELPRQVEDDLFKLEIGRASCRERV